MTYAGYFANALGNLSPKKADGDGAGGGDEGVAVVAGLELEVVIGCLRESTGWSFGGLLPLGARPAGLPLASRGFPV